MKGLQVQPEAWAPFAEGLKGMFTEPALLEKMCIRDRLVIWAA